MDKLLQAAAGHAALVEDVRFRLRVRGEKVKTGRPLLVISTHDMPAETLERLRRAYLEFEGISFPLKERAKHTMVRIDDRVYNFGRVVINWLPTFRKLKLRLGGRKLEVMLALDKEENRLMREYLGNIKRRRARVLGGFHMEGCLESRGRLNDNRPPAGFRHNCTSWVATAPVGQGGRALIEVLGGDRSLDVGRNPGWWASWLAAAASAERVPFLIHWTTEPLADALKGIKSGANFEWDFYRH